MIWGDFVWRFDREFALAIEVQQLVREFQDLHQTTDADEEMRKMRYHAMLR